MAVQTLSSRILIFYCVPVLCVLAELNLLKYISGGERTRRGCDSDWTNDLQSLVSAAFQKQYVNFFPKVFAKAEFSCGRFKHGRSRLNTVAARGRHSQLVWQTNCRGLKQRSVCSNRKLGSLESVLRRFGALMRICATNKMGSWSTHWRR